MYLCTVSYTQILLREKMQNRLCHLAKVTTCHGVVDCYEAKGFANKTFWIAILLAAFGAIGYYQYSLMSLYMTTPTATKLSKITVDSLQFPNITVCHRNG